MWNVFLFDLIAVTLNGISLMDQAVMFLKPISVSLQNVKKIIVNAH